MVFNLEKFPAEINLDLLHVIERIAHGCNVGCKVLGGNLFREVERVFLMQAIMEATFFAKDMINCMQQTQASSIATELLVGRTVELKANRACSIYFDTAIPVEMHVILSQLGGKGERQAARYQL